MVRIKNIDAIRRKIEEKIEDFKKSDDEMKKVAKMIRNTIVSDTREYKTFEGKDVKSTSITTAWLNRKFSLATGGLDVHGKASGTNKSNMTFTGALIRSIKAIVKGVKIELFFDGDHSPYNKGGKTVDNSKIYLGLIKQGFNPILGVSEKAKNRIKKQFRDFLRRK